MDDSLSAAISEAIALGNLCIMPPRQNGSKRPYPSSWEPYQKRMPTETELSDWYNHDLTGFGIICGVVSGNLEVLDFDERSIYNEWRQSCNDYGAGDLVGRLESGYMEHSPNGVHLLYRCSEIGGNTKLTTRPKRPEEMNSEHDKTKTLIETRGEGGYIVAAPSSGSVHPEGKAYILVSGSLSTIPVISPEERRELFTIARILETLPDATKKRTERLAAENTRRHGGLPGDVFNEQATWEEILEPHGWQFIGERNGVTYLRRPGKSEGISATIGHKGLGLLHNFSSSTPFETNKSCSKFGAYTVLEHGGDFSAASKALSKLGYEQASQKTTGNATASEDIQPEEGTSEELFISAADILFQPVEIKPLLGKMIERGTTGQLFGPSGGGKTFVALDMTLAVATGGEWNGNPCEQGIVLYFAGEGHAGLRRRVKAWHQQHGKPDLSCCHITRHAIPFDRAGLTKAVIDARLLVEKIGKTVALIVVDTLARHFQGDENSTQHMSEFVLNVDGLRSAFPGSTAIIVHHTGNDVEKANRSRGSSSLKAAMDFEIRCEKGLLTYTKVKDGEEPEPTEFKLVPVRIGTDEDGESITSCIVQYGERSVQNKQAVFTAIERVGIECLITLINASVEDKVDSGGKLGALVSDWRQAFYDARRILDPGLKQNTLKQSFNRTFETLLSKKVVRQDLNVIAPISDDHQADIKTKIVSDNMSQTVHGTKAVHVPGSIIRYIGTHPL